MKWSSFPRNLEVSSVTLYYYTWRGTTIPEGVCSKLAKYNNILLLTSFKLISKWGISWSLDIISQSSWVSGFVLYLPRCRELITCLALSVMIAELKHNLTVWMPYTPPRSEQETLCRYHMHALLLFSGWFLRKDSWFKWSPLLNSM